MLKRLTIDGFRGITSLHLEDFRRVNVFIGANGAGKTSVLEAVHVVARPFPGILAVLGQWREMPPLNASSDDAIRTVFPALDTTQAIALGYEDDAGARRLVISPLSGLTTQTVRTSTTEQINPLPPLAGEELGDLAGVRFHVTQDTETLVDVELRLIDNGFTENVKYARIDGRSAGAFYIHARRSTSPGETSAALTRMYQSKTQDRFLQAIRRVDDRVRTMVPGSRGPVPMVLVDIGERRMVPMNVLGDGFCRVALMLTGAVFRPNQILIVDEIDSGLHHSVMEGFWRSVLDLASRYDFQLFCTTHSEEMLSHTIEAFADSPESLRVYRLDRVRETGLVTAQPYSFEQLQRAEVAGLDIR